ncbi:TrmB family transcriptional regulator [Paenibacillus urinalis]|uniref:Helix-turn-helix domain-containing protein n=1 Tax=Paenibacillus urinalis TaxID=521520 RepID=A0AAX3N0D4_9BACL|nr:TrmB family transcriptional regulator [Paenibacillus urinalis]WDH83083.1 helix-turn-helix domain-containing protein [Paenibacillus urinalis]
MEQLLAHLKNLGFTEMESKIMVDLSRQGASSGYEVAKRLGASRSNIYAMLQRLNAEGYLHCSKGEPARYSMLTPEELTSKISDNVRQSLHFVERSMPRHHPGSPGFYNMEGDRQVLDTLLVRVAQAEKEIVIDMCAEEAALFHEELRAAEERGVRLLWSYDADSGEQYSMLPWDPFEPSAELCGRKFSFVIDRQWCMLGLRGEECMTQALVTEHPLMVKLLLEYFAQELILYELEEDMGEELERRYGRRFEHMMNKYVVER